MKFIFLILLVIGANNVECQSNSTTVNPQIMDLLEFIINNFTRPQLTLTDTVSSTLVQNDFHISAAIDGLEEHVASEDDCLRQLDMYIRGLGNMEEWALRMFDATAKIEAGLLEGNIMLMGNYDECMKIDEVVNVTRINGKYCTSYYTSEEIETPLNLEVKNNLFYLKQSLGICVPAVCQPNSLERVARFLEASLESPYQFYFSDEVCISSIEAKEFSTMFYVSITFFAAIGFIMVFSTVYDIFVFQRMKTTKPNLFIAFSIYTNGQKLFSTKKSADSFGCLNGMRVISMAWIIAAHRYMYVGFLPLLNTLDVIEWTSKFKSIFITGGNMGVDTFFVTGGLLVVYVYLNHREKGQRVPLLMFYVHRLLRLTPGLAALVLFCATLMNYIGSGPLWPIINIQFQNFCEKNWWSTVLYIHNYVHPKTMCMDHTWYLAVDTQLYFFCPLLLFPLIKWPKRTIFLVVCIVLACCGIAFYISWQRDLPQAFFGLGDEEFRYLYVVSHIRAPSWLVGFVLGYTLFQFRNTKVEINKIIHLTLWLISLSAMAAIVIYHRRLGDAHLNLSNLERTLANSFLRTVWSIALSVIIFLCAKGYGGAINRFLSSSIFTVLIRLNYSIYLVHILVIIFSVAQERTSIYESYTNNFYYFWGDYFISAIVATIWTLAFESPIIVLEELMFGKFLDASSKFPYPGLGYSSRSDFGNYDQCLMINHNYPGGRILGKFCGIGLIIPDIHDINNTNGYFRLSVCKPDACKASDYNAIINQLLPLPFPLLTFADGSCSTTETEFSVGDIVTISIFGIIILFMFMSTIYDIFLYYFQLKSIHPLCVAFSVLSNGRKLLHISGHSTSKEQIEIFHGLRAISMMWIVAGHGMGIIPVRAVTNVETVENWTNNLSSFYMTSALLSVDTFFFMSGFLLAFQYFKGKTKTFFHQVASVPYMIIHRYLRLTPALLMIFLVVITVFEHLGSGPLYVGTSDYSRNVCEKYWWRTFLYIQNYYKFSDGCIPQAWYLSADMQMFLVSPLILIPASLIMKKNGFKITIWGWLTLNIFLMILPMVTKLVFTDYVNEYDTHSRLIDYFIGVMLGYFMRVKIDEAFLYMIKEKHKNKINVLTWTIIIFGMLVIAMCLQDQQQNHSQTSNSVFDSMMRPAWCIGLCWITYSCYHGWGGFVNWILCRPIYQILGRLTYCIYLVHITVILYNLGTARSKIFFDEYNSFYLFCGHYIMSVIIAIFWTLAFESPLIIIEKYFLGTSRPTKDKSKEFNIDVGIITIQKI